MLLLTETTCGTRTYEIVLMLQSFFLWEGPFRVRECRISRHVILTVDTILYLNVDSTMLERMNSLTVTHLQTYLQEDTAYVDKQEHATHNDKQELSQHTMTYQRITQEHVLLTK